MKNIGIIGCGWLGSRIAHSFSNDTEIFVTTTREEKRAELKTNGYYPTLIKFDDDRTSPEIKQWDVIPNLDVLIVTVSFSERRNSEVALHQRFQNISAFIGNYTGQLFFMSTTGVYEGMDGEVREADVPFKQTIGERLIRSHYPQANILRLAGLMGDDRYLSKYSIKNTELAVNHIHYLDVCHVIQAMIEKGSNEKLYNVVVPAHPSKEEVIRIEKGKTYTAIESPKGKKVSPKKMMQELGFDFQHPDPRFFKVK